MTRIVLILTLSLPLSAMAGAGGEGHSATELFWKGFNVLLFLGVVYWFARKPVGEAFNRFWQSLSEEVERSEQELMLAKSDLKKAKEELEKAKVRADESIALTRESAQAEINRARQHATDIAERVKEKARETIEIELKRAKEELSRYGMERAQEIARQMLREAFSNPEIQRKYIEAQIKVLEERKND